MRLRAHHLLCLHGFRGEGYSSEFVANMTALRDRLLYGSPLHVEVLDSPDDICTACPHLSEHGCARKDGESEARVGKKDGRVLARLGLSAGDGMPSDMLLGLVAEEFGDGNIEDICGYCSWYPLGWCSDGLRECAGRS